MLKLIPVLDTQDLPAVLELYERAFPENERSPLDPMLEDDTGSAEILSAHTEVGYCGFICILQCNDIVHIIYFAVEEQFRGQGMGTQILEQIVQEYPGKRVIVDIEMPEEGVENNAQRIRRKAFYLRCGFLENDFSYNWRETNYTVLSKGGNLSHEEFRNFWKSLTTIMPQARIY